jgi:hypothetical protein
VIAQKATGPVKVVHPEGKPVPKEILAEAIVRVGESIKALNEGGLNRHAIVVLLVDATKLPKRDINLVLDALPRLRSWYCR